MTASSNEVHVLPLDDLLPHEASDDCPCLPVTEAVEDDDERVCGWLVSHHAWDGRE